MERIRVVLADDHPVVRAGVRTELQAVGLEVVGEVDNGKQALLLVAELCPDVLVLDMEMPVMNGLEVARQLQKDKPGFPILVLSAYDHESYIFDLLEAGVLGYVLKEEAIETIAEAVQAVAQGKSWLSPKVGVQVMRRYRKERVPKPELTERELAVLRLLAQGWDNRRIAQALFLAEQTIKNHISRIYAKLGVESRIGATIHAFRLGLIAFDDMSIDEQPSS